MSELLKKYDRPLPRYTSYPTVPYWKGISAMQWEEELLRCARESGQHPELSLYVHVPYCRSLCSFCGCTKVISRDMSNAEPFVNAILRELSLKMKRYFGQSQTPVLRELHLG